MATLNPISASAGGREHAFVCTPIPRFTQSESYGSSFELYIEAKSYQQGKGGIREAEALVLLDDEGACQFSVKSSFPIRYTDLHGNVHLSVRWRSMISAFGVYVNGKRLNARLLMESIPSRLLCVAMRCSLPPWWLWSIRIFLSNATSVCPVKCFMMMPPIRKEATPTTPMSGANERSNQILRTLMPRGISRHPRAACSQPIARERERT
mmetsp:Transcript_10574/g.32512  ORF Transcript_10574/g.32512 Transcript_10574/m.32512 type:complete len:209 (+) Transcript_10574:200-826(+)